MAATERGRWMSEDVREPGAAAAPAIGGWSGRVAPTAIRVLSPGQVTAIRAVMRLFVEDDLEHGVSPQDSIHCDACRTAQPAPGFIRYDGDLLCNPCAVDYEIARASGLVLSAHQYIRDRSGPQPTARGFTPTQSR